MPPASAKAISAAKEKFLKALAELNYFGKTTFDIKDAAKVAGYACVTGKAIRAAIKELKDDEIFTRTKDEITLTEKGKEALPQVDASTLPTDAEKQEKLMEQILKEDPDCKPITKPDKTKAVFDVLLDGKSHTKLELVEVAGYKRLDTKQIRNLFKRMIKLGVLENIGSGSVRFTDAVWPIQGRPKEAVPKDDSTSDSEVAKKPAVTSKKSSSSSGTTPKEKKKLSGRKRKTLTAESDE